MGECPAAGGGLNPLKAHKHLHRILGQVRHGGTLETDGLQELVRSPDSDENPKSLKVPLWPPPRRGGPGLSH